ncbi:hypothetical protein FA13DRAFT_1721154 [Coprinellus micaceus]|uniref:Uncharacterized protein n=1 Tax=Coprinellus micaceus TaxID=71717 RepID=A0A4Y7S2V9_COPMI|nr:hypothetical protein FA13DRAFT_1721154 [Coprinellus micaceus]
MSPSSVSHCETSAPLGTVQITFSPHLLWTIMSQAEVGQVDPGSHPSPPYKQLSSITMMATFTGSVQIAILSFMNDLLAAGSIQAELFRPDPNDPRRTKYTFYSCGVMVGLVAVALDIGVAAIAAVNAALAYASSTNTSADDVESTVRHSGTRSPEMEARALFCMVLLFVSLLLSGMSLISLSIEFDPSFSVFLAILSFAIFAGIVIAAYRPVIRFGRKWMWALRSARDDMAAFHVYSLLASTVAFVVCLARPRVPSFWYAVTAYGFTILYHLVAVLHEAPSEGVEERPNRLVASTVTSLAIVWVGCVVATVSIKMRSPLGPTEDEVLKYLIAALAGLEGLILAVTAAKKWKVICVRRPRETGNPSSRILYLSAQAMEHEFRKFALAYRRQRPVQTEDIAFFLSTHPFSPQAVRGTLNVIAVKDCIEVVKDSREASPVTAAAGKAVVSLEPNIVEGTNTQGV